MNRRSFLKLSLAAVATAYSPSMLTAAISEVVPTDYKGWRCRIDDIPGKLWCKQVYWEKGNHCLALLFDKDTPIAKMIEASKISLNGAIKRLKKGAA